MRKSSACDSRAETAKAEAQRQEQLAQRGFATGAKLDEARAASEVASNALKSAEAERSVITQQVEEGDVLAPAQGRVLTIPVTVGAVVMPGETIAKIAANAYVLRLELPERHARFIKTGDPVVIGGRELAAGDAPLGKGVISLVYPELQDGRVIADAQADGLGKYFVGERVLVWISAGKRQDHRCPARLPLQAVRPRLCAARSRTMARPSTWLSSPVSPRGSKAGATAIEVLGGLEARRQAGAAMKFGISGNLTRAFIASPLTPLLLLSALMLGGIALVMLPREEEPQISVPMVDIQVRADGLKAQDAARLVTEPLETIVKAINGVEHVYSQTDDDRVLVTARFLVGTKADEAILRVHEKVRANLDRIPIGIPEPLIVGRGIDDVAILTLDARAEARGRRALDATTRSITSPRTCGSSWPRSTMSASPTSLAGGPIRSASSPTPRNSPFMA